MLCENIGAILKRKTKRVETFMVCQTEEELISTKICAYIYVDFKRRICVMNAYEVKRLLIMT